MKHVGVVIVLALAFAAHGGSKAEGADMSGKTRFDGMKIRDSRPRIWLDDGRVAWLKKKMAGKSAGEVRTECGSSTEGLALAYLITGDARTGREAVQKVLEGSGRAGKASVATGAIVYDWCYPLLSGEEKKTIRDRAIPWCKGAMKNGRNWRSFHNGLYSTAVPVSFAAIAFSGDDPFSDEAFAFLNPEWEDVLRTFENVFPDGAWGEGFDYNRHVSYDAMRYFLALKTATGEDFIADSLHLRNTVYYIMYCTKPNGLVIPEKDCDFPFVGEWERDAMLMLASEYRIGCAQHYLDHCPSEEFAPAGRNKWKDVLWYDPALAEADPAALPASRIFRDDGLVIARSGWGWDSPQARSRETWMAFRCGRYYGDHAHYDNNSFEIYCKGELAIDSGRYDDDWGMEQDPKEIAKSQFFNYYQRTIAHNCVLVYDPNEKLEMDVLNDGGQSELLRINGLRNVPEDYDQGAFPSEEGKKGTCDWRTNPGRWDTGEIIAYKATEDFTYVCGDATRSYSDTKVRSFLRQFVFVQPNVFVVFDRVVSTKPEFKKTWLLHTVDEPVQAPDGAYYEAKYGEGRLVFMPLLPEKRTITKTGGPGNEFLVGGIHYACGPNASSGRKADLNRGELPGGWRIEESPADPAAEDYFLNVILVTQADSTEKPYVNLSKVDDREVALTVTSGKSNVAQMTFAKGDRPGLKLKIDRGVPPRRGSDGKARMGEVIFEGRISNGIELEQGRP